MSVPHFLLAGLSGLMLGLAGCSSDPQSVGLFASTLRQRASEPLPAFAAAAAAGAPGVVAALEDRPGAVALFLHQARSESGGTETLIGADGAQIMLRAGLLVGTRGFGGDLLAADVAESRSLVRALGSGTTTRLMTFLSGEDRAVTRAFRCRLWPGATEAVPVGQGQIMARTMTEHCQGADDAFYNFYWVVPATGVVIQSSQWMGAASGKVSLRVARAPRPDRR